MVSRSRDTGFYDRNFARSADEVNAGVRAEAFGEDIGQFSWTTAEEHRRFQAELRLGAASRVLEVASGSGGPGLFLVRSTGCRLVGIDVHEGGVDAATAAAEEDGLAEKATFLLHDAQEPLPFADASFDAVICIDSMNHLFDRDAVFREWARVLTDGGRFLFTDAVVVRGPLRREEMARRSPGMGEFLFTPFGWYERALVDAGFVDVCTENVTANIVGVAERWHAARENAGVELRAVEGPERYEEFQQFLATTALIAREDRLGRYAYTGSRPAR
ncbi:MAG TPA: methyltransferase domain-containing protein [Gaiella sp.]